jgi:hypothetical protein
VIHGDYLALLEFRFLGHIQPNVCFFLVALCVTWLIQLWHDSFVHLDDYLDLSEFKCMYVQVLGRFSKMFVWFWLLHVWHDSFICDMTHSYVTWLIHMWHVPHKSSTHIHLWRDSCTRSVLRAATHIEIPVLKYYTYTFVTWLVYQGCTTWSDPH